MLSTSLHSRGLVSLDTHFVPFVPCLIAVILSFLIVSVADAQRRFLGRPDPSTLESEEATKREIERIQKLAPSKSAALNQEALGDAKIAIDSYSGFPERIAEL